jgi:hypothetical protein
MVGRSRCGAVRFVLVSRGSVSYGGRGEIRLGLSRFVAVC